MLTKFNALKTITCVRVLQCSIMFVLAHDPNKKPAGPGLFVYTERKAQPKASEVVNALEVVQALEEYFISVLHCIGMFYIALIQNEVCKR